jgi:hypothetical protein
MPGPCWAEVAAQARPDSRAGPARGTDPSVPGRSWAVLFRAVLGPAHCAWPIWPSIPPGEEEGHWFDWCTWDAFYTDVITDGVKSGLQRYVRRRARPFFISLANALRLQLCSRCTRGADGMEEQRARPHVLQANSPSPNVATTWSLHLTRLLLLGAAAGDPAMAKSDMLSRRYVATTATSPCSRAATSLPPQPRPAP